MIVFARMAPARTVLVAVATFALGITKPVLMTGLIYRYVQGADVSARQWLFALFGIPVGILSVVRFCPAAAWLLYSLATKHRALLAFDGASLIGISWGYRKAIPIGRIQALKLKATQISRQKYLHVDLVDGGELGFALINSLEDEDDIMLNIAGTEALRPLVLAGQSGR